MLSLLEDEFCCNIENFGKAHSKLFTYSFWQDFADLPCWIPGILLPGNASPCVLLRP